MTRRRIKVTYSQFELSVVSSAISVRKGELLEISTNISSTWRPITFSFWIAGLVYTCTHSPFVVATQLGLGHPRPSFGVVAESYHPFPLTASPCLPKNLIKDRIWYSACRFFSFWVACCCESCSPMSCVVDGRVTITSTASQ